MTGLSLKLKDNWVELKGEKSIKARAKIHSTSEVQAMYEN